MLPALALPSRGGAALRALLVLALIALGVGVGAVPSAQAVGAPVVVDDFGGTVRGTRTVQVVNSGTSPDPTFTQSGGIGTMRLNGSGNSTTGIQLDYAFPQTDLTVGGSNTQFFVEFTGIQRTPEVLGENAASISISVTDSSGRTGVYNTGIGNTGDWDVVLNFECTSSPVCFSPQVDFTRVTALSLLVLYPRNQDPAHETVVTIDALRTTPTGGVAPTPPAPEITEPATTGGTVYAATGTTLQFPVRFASDGAAVDVTGLSAADVVATGTAPGSGQLSLTGSGSSYVVRVGPITGDGTVGVRLPAGVVQDAWGQDSTAAEASVEFYVSVPPAITGALPTAATIGTAFSADLAATGRPAPTFSVTAGSLPPGLTLSSGGRLAGTPTTGGTYTFTVGATNALGSATQASTLTVTGPPVLDHAPTATFTRGQAGSFGVTAGGYPVPTITAAGLPAGLTLTDRGDGTASITGTPTVAGTTSVTLTATNSVATRTSTLAVTVQSAPSITSSDDATFVRGAAGSFTVSTTGVPAPALTITAGTVPAGLTFVDNGDGTATISGTPTASGIRLLTVRAQNAAGTATQQLWVTSLDAPAITSDGDATFVVGRAGSTTITTTGFPQASLSATGTLPDGLSFVDNGDGTATLAGTPTTAGTSTLTVTAANGVSPSARRTLTVVVQQAPAFSSATDATMTVDQPGSFVVRTTGSPAAALTLVDGDLPVGLSLTDNGDGTATLSGTPETSGTTSLTLRATNAAGSQEQVLALVVVDPLRFTTPDHVLLVVGQPATFDVLSDGYPAPLSAGATCTAPDGLTVTPLGVHGFRVAGTPTHPGATTCTFSVQHPLSGVATQTVTLDVASTPAVTSPGTTTFVTGRAGTFLVTASGSPAPALSVGTLPAGLTFVDHGDGTGTLSGTPTTTDHANVPVTATNAAGSVTTRLEILMYTVPEFSSPATATFTRGAFDVHSLMTSGTPTATLSLVGSLPPGLEFEAFADGSGVIAGAPLVSGTFPVVVLATNDAGTEEQHLSVVVREAPAVTSASTAQLPVGTPGSWTVTTTGHPAPALTLTGTLPAGLTFSDEGDGTATITGTPTVTGSSDVTITATNAAGSDDQVLTLDVVSEPVFTSAATVTFPVGEASSFDVTTSGYPDAALTLAGTLPAGLTFTDQGDGTATIAGTPTEDGPVTVELTATSAAGTSTQTLRVLVTRAPVITSPDAAPFAEGSAGRFVVRATGTPLPALTLTGTLPAGLTFTDEGDGTAVIAGTPAPGSAGTYRVTITAVAAVPAPVLRRSGLAAAALAGAPLALGDSQTLVITVAGDDSGPDDGGTTPGGSTPGGSTPGDGTDPDGTSGDGG
ncbi:beta strand repeat-containing protein, partial [Cellulomonas massiliensis]|uniref:beta strand repeat-containing protein n=1 Tax=Cellulomonas massiliensis TaxID=1465811 RepID=UPI000371BB14